MMSITTTRLRGYPAVVATHKAFVTRDEIEKMYEDTEAILGQVHAPRYYRINDVRESYTNFNEFMQTLLVARQEGPFRTSDDRLEIIFVGNNQWVFNLRTVFAQRGRHFPVFHTMAEAVQYVEMDYKRRRGNKNGTAGV